MPRLSFLLNRTSLLDNELNRLDTALTRRLLTRDETKRNLREQRETRRGPVARSLERLGAAHATAKFYTLVT